MFRYYLWLLLLVPSLAYSHGGIPKTAMVLIFVIWPAIISIVYGVIVWLIQWRQWFSYLWLTVVSSLISFLMLLLWGASVFTFTATFQESYFSAYILVALFMVVVINLIVVIWSFNTPKKQYRQLGLDKADSINEALGIKNNK